VEWRQSYWIDPAHNLHVKTASACYADQWSQKMDEMSPEGREALNNYCSHFRKNDCLCITCDVGSMDLLLAINELEDKAAQLTAIRNRLWDTEWEAFERTLETKQLRNQIDLLSKRYEEATLSGEAYNTGYENGLYDGQKDGYEQGLADGERYADGRNYAG
jgi:hypothetical protein